MIGLLLWPAVCFALLALALSYPLVVRPQLDHRRHERTLANIARLEVELGYDVPLEQRIDRELTIANRQWYDAALAKTTNYVDVPVAKRIYGECAMCGRRVAVNAGRCQGATRSRTAECAKLAWLRSQQRQQ